MLTEDASTIRPNTETVRKLSRGRQPEPNPAKCRPARTPGSRFQDPALHTGAEVFCWPPR